MHAKLTQAVAEKCEPNSGDYEIVDTLIPGFVLRVRPSGVKAWEYRYRNQEGRQRRYVVGRFPGVGAMAARRMVLTLAADVATGAASKRESAMPDWKASVSGTTRSRPSCRISMDAGRPPI